MLLSIGEWLVSDKYALSFQFLFIVESYFRFFLSVYLLTPFLVSIHNRLVYNSCIYQYKVRQMRHKEGFL